MSDPLRDVFIEHEPPPGGLARLRERLDAPRAPRLALGFAVAVAAALLVTLRTPPAPELSPPEPPAEPVTLAADAGRVALQRVETGDAQVIYYRVGRVP
ncbi:MAG: hypothetical protein H6739_22720 [Alphaproteobacteria bacterium]|nr:hypothetical protein [Alphaproteobacteria bacterium]